MPPYPPRLLLSLVIPLVALMGCRSPAASLAKGVTGQLDAPAVAASATPSVPLAAPTRPPVPPGVEPLAEPTADEAFAQILGDLQRLGAENPAAQQELLRQLQTTKPAYWAPLAQRFRSDLDYQRQALNDRPWSAGASAPATATVPPTAAAPSTEWAPPTPAGAQAPGSPVLPTGAAAPPVGVPPMGPMQVSSTPAGPPHRGVTLAWPAEPPASQQGVRPASAEAAVTGPVGMSPKLVGGPPAQPPASTDPQAWDDLAAEAVRRLGAEAPDQPQTTAEAYRHARLGLLKTTLGDMDGAVAPVPGLSTAEQDFWSRQLMALCTMLDSKAQPDTGRRAAAAGVHLAEAQARLGHIASLAVVNPTFCKRVYGYGAYEPYDQARFTAGQKVTLYVEVENFTSERTDRGYRSALATGYRVVDDAGHRVDGGDLPVVEDECLSRRRDFHIQYGVTLPRAIYPGKYQMELTLTDQVGHKIGLNALPFEIVEGGP